MPDEFTQALIALNVARQAGIERIVYLSVIHADVYVNVPHFAGKFGVERMIEQMGFNATILRPAYFINNDLTIKDVVLGHGVYPMPIGSKGLAMIDARDIGEVAAIELMRREQAAGHAAARPDQPRRSRYADRHGYRRHLVRSARPPGRLWRRRHRRRSSRTFRQLMPSWMAYDMRLMGERFPDRRHAPGGRRRRAPDCAFGPAAALLSRLRIGDSGLIIGCERAAPQRRHSPA